MNSNRTPRTHRTRAALLAVTAVATAAGALAVPSLSSAAPNATAANTTATKASPTPAAAGDRGLNEKEEANRDAAVRLLIGSFTKHKPATFANRYIDADTYIQHNPQFGNGRDAFIAGVTAYLQQFPDYTLRVKRTVAQGNYVVVHGLAKVNTADRGTAEIDIFRFNKSGKLVEHWDALQPIAETSVNGNPQV